MKNEINVNANDVIAHYRTRVDDLELNNTVLELQVKTLQAKVGELEKNAKPAEIDPAPMTEVK